MERISAQPPIWSLPSINSSLQPRNPQKNAHHALHHLCLVSEPTILYLSANVSLPQPYIAFPSLR